MIWVKVGHDHVYKVIEIQPSLFEPQDRIHTQMNQQHAVFSYNNQMGIPTFPVGIALEEKRIIPLRIWFILT
jgi:hypothetical protein